MERFFKDKIGQRWLFFDLETHQSFILNETASLIFDLVRKNKDIAEIIDVISDKFNQPKYKIKKDIKKLFVDLEAKGIMTLRT